MLAFRSIVVPLKSVLMNLLSVGASYGLLVLVFQHGIGNEVFGFQQVERIDAWVPLMMFSILFGLSMDYHVFLLSRIRERYDLLARQQSTSVSLRSANDRQHDHRRGADHGCGLRWLRDGRVIDVPADGVRSRDCRYLDATVIRSILVPASMRLLGDLNWYFPSWLEWLPKFNVEGIPDEPERPRTRTGGRGLVAAHVSIAMPFCA